MRSDQISHGEKMCRNAEKEMGFYLKDTHTHILSLSLSLCALLQMHTRGTST